jgi:glutamate synthase domain-containing protein 3
LQNHLDYTKSPKAKTILENWSKSSKNFIKVMPTDYKRALEMMANKETEKTV